MALSSSSVSGFGENIIKVGDFSDNILNSKDIGRKSAWNKEIAERYARVPVVRLLDDQEFLGKTFKPHDPITGEIPSDSHLWQCHREDIILLWKLRKSHGVNLALFLEAIGSGKSLKAATILYLLSYEILTDWNFYERFHMVPKSRVSLITMSRTYRQSKEVMFDYVVPLYDCQFFNTYFPAKINFEDVRQAKRFPDNLRLPNNLWIFAGTGEAGSALGFSPYGVVIDEANHLRFSSASVRAEAIVTGGRHDEAEQMYNVAGGRIGSRFRVDGVEHGLLVMLSDPRFLGDFTEKKYKQALNASDFERIDAERFVGNKTFCVRRSIWGAKPWAFSGETFKFDTDTYKIVG